MVQIVCDVGSNWRDGPKEDLGKGRQRWRDLIKVCADAGADAVKGQYLRRTAYPEHSKEAQLVAGYEWPPEWLPWLQEECYRRGVEWLCTVFEEQHVAHLNPFVHRWKIASFEALHFDLLRACRRTRKPFIISTGTLDEDEVDSLWSGQVWSGLGRQDVLLYCVSKYPAAPEDYDLNVLADWCGRVPCRVGLSDHTGSTEGATAAVMAVAVGALMVETHVTLSHAQDSPDAAFARSPRDLSRYVQEVRRAERMVGDGEKKLREGELVQYRYDPATGKRGVASHTTKGGR